MTITITKSSLTIPQNKISREEKLSERVLSFFSFLYFINLTVDTLWFNIYIVNNNTK